MRGKRWLLSKKVSSVASKLSGLCGRNYGRRDSVKLNQDIIENLFSAIRGMGGADTNPDPVTFCNRIRILKIQEDYDPIKLLIAGTKTSVELSPVDEILQEPFIASEIGIKDGLQFDHLISLLINQLMLI